MDAELLDGVINPLLDLIGGEDSGCGVADELTAVCYDGGEGGHEVSTLVNQVIRISDGSRFFATLRMTDQLVGEDDEGSRIGWRKDGEAG